MKIKIRQKFALPAIIIAFFLLGIVYAWATPPLEASDEYKHYPFVQYVQNNWRLPVLEPENPGLWLQEAAQPPLYYLLAAAVTAGIDTTDLEQVHHKNPQAFIGNPGQVGNKNLIIHDPQLEAFPWRGSVLAIYIGRLLSLVLGAGTVLVVARLGTQLLETRVGLLAAALTAFNPMFLFVATAVNNDSLAIFLGNLSLLLMIIIWQKAPNPRRHWWQYIFLGVVLGLGVLSKLSLLGLLIPVGLMLTWMSWRSKKWQTLIIGGMLIVLPVVVISGWWFFRNWQIYGDPTGLAPFIAVQGIRDSQLNWAGWLDEWGTFYRSYWGLFGGVNIAAPEWFYLLMNFLALVALIGFFKRIWSRRRRKRLMRSGAWLLMVWLIVILLLLIRWNSISPAFQGRLIFPAIGAISVLGAVGFLSWFDERRWARVAVFLGTLLFMLAMLIPFLTIRPVYAAPQPLMSIPAQARIEPVIFHAPDGQLKLIGVEMVENQAVVPGGGPVTVTLYWQMENPVAADYISSLHLLGRDLESAGQIDRYPAMGLIPTSRWQPGEIYRDDYHIYAAETAVSPSLMRVAVNMYNPDTEQTLAAAHRDGLNIDPLWVGSPVRLNRPDETLPEMDAVTYAQFDQGISLLGIDYTSGAPGELIPITLYWQAARTPDQEYTVFVHLLNSEGERIAGADAPPVNNFYPTSWWRNGDLIDDTHLLQLPDDLSPGSYKVIVGLYDPLSGARVARTSEQGDHAEFSIDVKHE
ncbi:MAG: glycosyltransferase family 39 protein [Candidatus Promineifilaceae bacterium]|nr:glycosyltransferase family 39 protein [Candidatus Promineifilaceae bacterium]